MTAVAIYLLLGVVVGFVMGMTGGGGAILAVPALVYALAVPAHSAVGISLLAVGTTSGLGVLERLRRREVDVPVGLLFAALGMVGAPIGAWINSLLPPAWLLTFFAVLMTVVAFRTWRAADTRIHPEPTCSDTVHIVSARGATGSLCRQQPDGKLRLDALCACFLAGLGLLTGVLSGLFGVGGGFIIVPALVLFTGMAIRRAIATSLLVISLVSVSGVASYLIARRPIDLDFTGLFVAGGILGMLAGTRAARYIPTPTLQKAFAATTMLVALFTVAKTLAAKLIA